MSLSLIRLTLLQEMAIWWMGFLYFFPPLSPSLSWSITYHFSAKVKIPVRYDKTLHRGIDKEQ